MAQGKKKSRAGRKPKMNQATVDKLETAFSYGCTDLEACFFAGIHKQTLYNYQEKHPEFVDRKEQLKENPVLLARESVVKSLRLDPNLALKYLERKKKDEFSPRTELTDPNGKPLPPITIKIIGQNNEPGESTSGDSE